MNAVGDPPRAVLKPLRKCLGGHELSYTFPEPKLSTLEFAPCPKGCPGSGSARHIHHRFVEMGYEIPGYILDLRKRGWK